MNDTQCKSFTDIVEYGNRFHHDTNPAWQTEEINSTELLGFVQRTLAFVGPPNRLGDLLQNPT